jgi:hypothetical protein
LPRGVSYPRLAAVGRRLKAAVTAVVAVPKPAVAAISRKATFTGR